MKYDNIDTFSKKIVDLISVGPGPSPPISKRHSCAVPYRELKDILERKKRLLTKNLFLLTIIDQLLQIWRKEYRKHSRCKCRIVASWEILIFNVFLDWRVPGSKIIKNILFGAAFARKVFYPYSSGTQWIRCY